MFVAIEDDGSTRMFCLTALHVAVMADGEHSGSFYRQTEDMRMHVANNDGKPLELQPRFAPDRWLAESSHSDVAWVEINSSDIAAWRSEGADVKFVPAGRSPAEILERTAGDSFLAGVSVLRHSEGHEVGLSDKNMICAILPDRVYRSAAMACASGGITNVTACLNNDFLNDVVVPFEYNMRRYCLKTNQLVAEARTSEGDSGSPAFAFCKCWNREYPFLIGIVSAYDKINHLTSIMPLDDALLVMRSSFSRKIDDVLDCCEDMR